MAKICYCTDKKSRKSLSLFFASQWVSSFKEIASSDCQIVICDEHFLKKHKSIKPALLDDKIWILHFAKQRKCNLAMAQKYNFFDCLSDEDTKEDVDHKLARAAGVFELKKRIVNLELHLLQKNKKIEKITLVDPLTNCYNWRYFLSATVREINRSRRHLYSVSFVGVDIDHFRQVNELYGITVADAVTKELVSVLRSALRKEDVLSRWRSDEFFIIMPHLKNKDAYKVAQRIQNAISSHRFSYQNIKLSIKASIAVASSPEDSVFNSRDIINALDKCLIAAKRKGGNTIVLHSQAQLQPERVKKVKANLEELKVKIDKMNIMLTRDLLEMIYGFARAIEAKDFYTGKHVEITASLAEAIAKELALPPTQVENVKHAAVLHDLGKVGIDKGILSKEGKLTAREREIIETHPSIAAEILREIHGLRGSIPAILYHHERWDGTGYPLGLKGEEIPLSARIVAIADVYQALTSDRPYRKAFTKRKSLEIIKVETGTHFDPKIVDIFLKIVNRINGKG